MRAIAREAARSHQASIGVWWSDVRQTLMVRGMSGEFPGREWSIVEVWHGVTLPRERPPARHEHERGAPLTDDCDGWCRGKFERWERNNRRRSLP